MTRSPSIEQLDKNFVTPKAADGLLWHDLAELPLEGRGWGLDRLATPFDRLPADAKPKVREAVWTLSQHSAGLCLRFLSDATQFSAKWSLRTKQLAMDHMPATGVSGVDLYVRENGRWRWLAIGRPSAVENSATLSKIQPSPAGGREFMLYLPLYNGIVSLQLGVNEDAFVRPPPPRAGSGKPVVVYGTSITQGGCACRPGMAYPAILGRFIDREVINLGFSGNGPMEAELCHYLAEIDASVYVLDCLPNMGDAQVTERTLPAVKILRDARPETPIVLVENVVYQQTMADTPKPGHWQKNLNLRTEFAKLLAMGVKGLHYVPGDYLLGTDYEGTVDGVHPTDIGFLRMAEIFAPVLRPLV
ncbi:MAG: SGNH/GDSL hydrolase family protein [Planctomycetota bacterium]|nr:SGNH/GDSL hydrolase family protein [Planctomycetota bacterium]